MFIRNIPIRVNPIFLLLILAIGWLNTFSIPGTIIWMAVIFASVLIHELGHALTAQYFGHQAQIELFALGGVTRRRGPPLNPWKEFLIVLNGPLAGFALFILAFQAEKLIAGRPAPYLLYAVHVTWVVNLFWTIINLLPIQPLDGGHLLRIFLEGIFGIRGVKIALFTSMLLSAVASLLFIVLGQFLIGALFFLFTFENYRSWKESLAFTTNDQSDSLQKMLKMADKEVRAGNYYSAEELLNTIREEAKTGMVYLAASEYLAQIKAKLGQLKEAHDILIPHVKKLSGSSLLLLHQLAFQVGNVKEAIDLGNRAFQNYPNYETAVINALCHSTLGQAHPAVGWLQTAINEGLPNLAEVLERPEFDYIRNTPQFQKLLDK